MFLLQATVTIFDFLSYSVYPLISMPYMDGQRGGRREQWDSKNEIVSL